jgi:ribose/xylose/arabinose/galactoside ABC-type transport system permease subunit
VLALGAFTGFLNGLLVEVAKIDSFIATLGTGTVLYALALWHTGGRQMVGVLPDGVLRAQQHLHLRSADHGVSTCSRSPSRCG